MARRGFDTVVLLVGWRLWLEHNSRTFDATLSLGQEVFLAVREDAKLWDRADFHQLWSLLSFLVV